MTAVACIAVVGGYGAFGARVVERLARSGDIEIVIAGRSPTKAAAAATRVGNGSKVRISAAEIDAVSPNLRPLLDLHANVVINASGPFQQQNYALAQACIASGIHYIDLADARAFVTGIVALDQDARAADVLVTSGASTVPAISSAAADHFLARFARLDEVAFGVSPGNSFDPGLATTESVLTGVGRPIAVLRDGRPNTVYGWQGLSQHVFPVLGKRWLGHCDIPDLTLFPQRYPSLKTIDFRAGVEVPLFHFSLWLLSWMVRWRLLSRLAALATSMLAVKRRLDWLGTDKGGMFMTFRGQGIGGGKLQIDWYLIAGHGHGPYIPALAAVILARRLSAGTEQKRGAMPCIGLVSLAEILSEVGDLDIQAVAL